jgi:hypothetical protein
MRETGFILFADYFQIHIQDEMAKGIDGASWTPEAYLQRLALERDAFAVMTARNMEVPLVLRLHPEEPDTDIALWDHIVEFAVDIPSGQLVVAGCTDPFPTAARVTLPKGTYRVRVCHAGLDRISDDGLDGEDHYLVELWQGGPMPLTIRKAYQVG